MKGSKEETLKDLDNRAEEDRDNFDGNKHDA